MDQPYSRCADMLLDTQYYSPNDPQPYDDTGWTLGALYGVKTIRIMDQEILDVSMDLVTEIVKPSGKVSARGKAAAYLVNHTAENALIKFRYQLDDIKMLAAESGFKVGEKKFNAGTFTLSNSNV